MTLTETPICNFGEKAKDFNLLSTENKKVFQYINTSGGISKKYQEINLNFLTNIKIHQFHFINNMKLLTKKKIESTLLIMHH